MRGASAGAPGEIVIKVKNVGIHAEADGDLDPGETVTVKCSATYPSAGDYTHQVSVAHTHVTDQDPSNNVRTATSRAR